MDVGPLAHAGRGGVAVKPNPKKLCELYDAMETKRKVWECLWQDIALYVIPRKYPGMNGSITSPGTETESRLFDNTAVEANQTNANGCLAWMTPAESVWFAFTPPEDLKDDTAKTWLAKASQSSRNALARSNYYLAVHEFFLDRSAFGTACLYAEPGKRKALSFKCWPVGTFVMSEDYQGEVDTVIRKFKLTAEQAEEQFGREALSEKIIKCLAKGGAALLEEFEFLHFIMPRKQEDRKGNVKQRMPIACFYIEKDSRTLVRESGYNEMPVFVSRYMEWGTTTGGLYGWAPSWTAMPEARQLNFIQKMLDLYAEVAIFPPWLAPAGMEGEIDPNAAGVTYFSEELQAHQMPRQMSPPGRYDIGMDRVKAKQEAIERAFQVPMFQLFNSMEKPGQMTAREVMERSQEKLVNFSPTFARIQVELTNPLMRWLFDTLLEQGAYGPVEEIPSSLIQEVPGGLFIATPQVQYSSRIALALRQLPTLGFWRTLDMCAAIATGKQSTEIYDCFDTDAAVVNDAINNGVDPDIIRPKHVRDQIRNARAEAQRAQEEQEQMAAQADAAGKIGSIKQDSVAGKMIQQAA